MNPYVIKKIVKRRAGVVTCRALDLLHVERPGDAALLALDEGSAKHLEASFVLFQEPQARSERRCRARRRDSWAVPARSARRVR